MFRLIYDDKVGETVYRTVTHANLIAVAQEVARRTGKRYSYILGFLENRLKRSEHG